MANNRADPSRGRKRTVVKATRKTSPTTRAFYIVVGAIAVLGIAALSWATTRPTTNAAVGSRIDTSLAPVKSEGYVIGSPSAKLEVTEFGDYECPVCGQFGTLTEPDILTRLVKTGQIRYRFIDYPLPMHENTWNASRAAACADRQGKFWEMHAAIYANQDRWNGEATSNPDKVLKAIGAKIPGMNTDSLDRCIDTKATQAKVQAHYAIATGLNINATPTFVFGDKQLVGFVTYDNFKAITDSILGTIAKGAPPINGLFSDSAAGVPLTVKNGK